MREVIASAPGKINLILRSGEAGEDGYHPLATVFEAVSLRDYVVARTRRQAGVTVQTSIYLPGTDPEGAAFDHDLTRHFQELPAADHLAVRAAKALQPLAAATAWGTTSSGVHLHVHKTLPVGGGMAGGSADAAATLVALNHMWDLGLSQDQLLAVGRRLGADVPACLLGGVSVGVGRGDQVQLVDPPLEEAHWWALAFDEEGLSTPAVFAEFDRLGLGSRSLPTGDPLAALVAGDATRVADVLENDLQPAALSLRPSLQERGAAAAEAGAAAWVVSGAGPTLAALASNRDQAEAICAGWAQLPGVAEVAVAFGPVPGARMESEPPTWVRA